MPPPCGSTLTRARWGRGWSPCRRASLRTSPISLVPSLPTPALFQKLTVSSGSAARSSARPEGRNLLGSRRSAQQSSASAAGSRFAGPARDRRLPAAERIPCLHGFPDRHELPPAVTDGHREVLGRAAAPVRDLQRLRRPPPVWPKIGG